MIETVGGSVEGEGGLIGFLVGDDGFDVASGGARTPDGEFFADIDGTFGEEFTGVDTSDGVVRIIDKGALNCVGDWLKGGRIGGGKDRCDKTANTGLDIGGGRGDSTVDNFGGEVVGCGGIGESEIQLVFGSGEDAIGRIISGGSGIDFGARENSVETG